MDRLKELKKVEDQSLSCSHDVPSLSFFEDFDRIKDGIRAIQDTITIIKDRRQDNKSFFRSYNEEEKVDLSLENKLRDTNRIAAVTKQQLKCMQSLLFTENTLTKTTTAEKRLQANMFQVLRGKFVEVMRDYQQAQQNYKNFIRRSVLRQVQTIQPTISYSEVDAIIQTDGSASRLLTIAILNVRKSPCCMRTSLFYL